MPGKISQNSHNPNREPSRYEEMKGKSWRAVADEITKDLETRDTEPKPVILDCTVAKYPRNNPARGYTRRRTGQRLKPG